jgi:hypothetical protein
MEQYAFIRAAGLLALVGALLYAVGDTLLLAGKASIENYPRLQPFARLLSGSERMIRFPPNRMIWGALLGVFSTPLILAGFWQVYQGLGGADGSYWTLITFVLFASASMIGAFVHGTFYYMGEYVHALNDVREDSQGVVADMISRHRMVLIVTYAPVLTFIFLASILFAVLVISGRTFFPAWMAAINPVTLTIGWLLFKRILPQAVRDHTEGAGFNIAYLAFFACTTATLWNG